MKAAVFPKAEGGASKTFSGNRITLEAPSVVQLQIGPEQVARFERDGNDLVLVLDDGSILMIEGFFVATAEGRNDLVFEDGNNVTWWAQYGSTWTGFDIAEINGESGGMPLALPLLGGLGALAAGLGGAMAGGSGDDGDTPSVTPPVTPPVGSTSPAETSEDASFNGVVTGSSEGGGDLTFELGGRGPEHGTVTVNPDGTYTYTPDPDYNGPDSFEVIISDGRGGTTIVTVPVTVTSVVDIVPDRATTQSGVPVTTSVLDNDSFESEDARITGVTPGNHGTVVVNPDGTITYTPEPGYVGEDTYTYTVTSGGIEETTTVTITVRNDLPAVNEPPIAAPEHVTTPEDTPVRGNLLSNDRDPDGDPLAITSFKIDGTTYRPGDTATIPGVGTLLITADGSYTFTPAPDWNGKVPTVTYTVSDGHQGGSTTSTLDITVTPVDDVPSAGGTIADQTSEDAESIGGVDVSGLFSDGDGDKLTYSASNLPDGLSINPDTGIISGTIDHSASQGGTGGVYVVTVTASDGHIPVDRTFTWTVTNPAPTANDDAATSDEDNPVSGNVLASGGPGDVADSDKDGDSLSVTGFTIAGDATAHNAGGTVAIADVGSFTLNGDGSYTFTPAPDWNGTVPTVTYTISDGEGGTDTADLVITINPTDDAPRANGTIADQSSEDADGIGGLDVSGFFSDADGDKLTYSASNLPDGLSIDPDTGIISGRIDHSASQGGTGGVYSVIVTATDGRTSVDQTFTWTVSNPVPVANDDAATTDEDTAVTGNVIGGANKGPDDVADSDEDGDSLSVTGFTIAGDATVHNAGETVTIADVGAFTLNGDGSYTFTPQANWSGTVPTITYTISDGEGGTDTADLVITVNPGDDLQAVDDSIATDEDTPVDGTVATNDSTTSGGTLTFAKETDPEHGSVIFNSDGTYTYTPEADYHGPDSFTYTVTDPESGESLTRTVDITVNPVNDAPVTGGTIADQANEDAQGITPLDVSTFFSDVDGDTLTYSADNLPEGLSINLNTGIVSGTINHSASQGGTGGVYSVTVTATDEGGLTVDRTFTWTVTNPVPVANDDAATTDEDTAVSGNVLGGGGSGDVADADEDGDSLSVTGFTIAGDVTPHDAGDSVSIDGVGTFTLGSDGAYTFTPEANWNGTVPTVTYTISDGEGGTDTADLVITVTPVDDVPEATGTIADQSSEDADVISGLDVSGFFSDVDDTLRYSASDLPAGLSIDEDTGVISGRIDNSASQGGTDGVYSVTVTAIDGGGQTTTQTFTWTVINPAPVANDDAATTDEETLVSGNVLGVGGSGDVDDTDEDGDDLSVTRFVIDGTTYEAGDEPVVIAGVGTFTLGSDGAYSFEPTANYSGPVPTVTYTISDGEGGTDTADLVITINPVNDMPVINEDDQAETVVEAGNLVDGTVVAGEPSVSGSFTASDPDGDDLIWSVLTPDTTYGIFSIDPDGAWTYTLDNELPATQALNEGDSVPLTFTVQVSDGNGGTDTRTVSITVTGTNDAPLANADTGAITEAGVLDGGNTATSGIASATGNVLTNDVDVDDGEKATLIVSAVDFGGTAGTLGSALAGIYGSLLLNSDGSYTYTLDNDDPDTQILKQGQSVTEVFTYIIEDVHGVASVSTLTITVTGTNDQPQITSTSADAAGEVIETGTGVAGTETATGTLTASDIDADATRTWSIASTDGTYGSIGIDPGTGEWTYTLDNERPATQALNNGDTRTETFTARVTDEHGSYSEQLVTVTVHGSNDDVAGSGSQTVTLPEDGSASGTLQDYVSDVDDDIRVTGFEIDADGDGADETYAPGAIVVIKDTDSNTLGTLTIEEDGAYSFTPVANYAGDVPTVTYTMVESGGGISVTQTLDFEITKVADAPGFEAAKTVSTSEDTAVPLGLKAPVITDTGTGTDNQDHPERLGAVTLTIGGAGAAGVTLSTGGTTLTPVGGKITIVLTDVDHVTSVPAEENANGIYHLTTAEYEALLAHPAAESGKDFTVSVSATSYEVDAGGAVIPGVTGAASTQVIDVDVQAVTDGAGLTIDGGTSASLTGSEDTTIDLTGHLAVALSDTDGNAGTDADGSETYWYSVSGLPIGTVVTIDGVATTITADVSAASSPTSASANPPSISITPPPDFSGDVNGVTVTLHTKDTDGDSSGSIATLTSTVTLDLHVTSASGDVSASDVITTEDAAVHFLAGVTVTDTGTDAGSEVIDSVSFEVPAGWAVAAPAPSSGWTYGVSGTTATITFDGTLSEEQRETVLDGFTIKPPAHSSTDATITLSIKTTDTNGGDSNTQTVDRDVKITVTPVAEQVDGDSAGLGADKDVTMNDDHVYSVAGKEDTWFALGTNYTDASNADGGYDQLKASWSNADADEFTYAVLTPTLESGAAGDTVIGAQFRYSTDGGASWQTLTYAGEALWVPAMYLDTLQVKLPPDVSGTMTIGVQAGTVDYDDDTDIATLPLNPPHVSSPGVTVDVTGSATLSMIEFDPVADAVTMALNGRASGIEDTPIPLSIKTTSSDASETFDVTISGIPDGAKIIYDGAELTVTGGVVTIEGFKNTAPLSITPSANSNSSFPLSVTAVSVDGTDTSAPTATRTIVVSVIGDADDAVVTLPAEQYVTTEADLDSGDHKVALSNLVAAVTSPDDDPSEITTLRITGLDDGFTITGATVVVSGTGTERVWVVAASNLANVSVVVPQNYSGTVGFQVAGVTTEDDGDSHTGALTDVSFVVTPSPEATITTGATLVEDEVTPLNLAVVHQNGDADETLGDIYVPVGYDTTTYTLHLGGTELSAAAGLDIADIGGTTYYVVPADQVENLGARGAPDKDGGLGQLDFLYEVIDPSRDGTLAPASEIKEGTLTLTATPVTDAVHASITGIEVTGTAETAENVAGDDATPDTVVVSGSDTVTVNLHVASDDGDGSEHLVRVLISGVPDGVTVAGASFVGSGSWLLVYDGSSAKPIGSGGIDVPVEFVVGQGAIDGTSAITMTVQARDEGQSAATPAGIEADSVSWSLVLDMGEGGSHTPPVIVEWDYNGNTGTEDTPFTLDTVIDATVSISDPGASYSYTVTLTDLPAGTVVSGMILTTIGGVPTWTATATVPQGGDSQAALQGLLAGIAITPPADGNDNNSSFSFDARLTASAVGGTSVAADTSADMPVIPVTDEASIAVATSDVGEGATSVTATITASDAADGAHGTIVDGKLYVQVSTNGNDGGTVTAGGQPLSLTAVSGVGDVPDGDYYVIDVGLSGGSVELTYTTQEGTVLQPGDVTFTVWTQTQETGAANTVTASASGTAGALIVNNGVTVERQAVTGNEPASAGKGNAIELTGLSVALNDNDGSETIHSILLSGVPVGFLIYVGNTASDATLAAQASNAGGDGSTNTWVLSDDGELPAYVAILPAPHWSGTLDNLSLVAESGETSLSATRVDTVKLEPLTVVPVADGLAIEPTSSFGTEGQIIDLNLNAAMVDPAAATAAAADGSTETTTLQIAGLGEYAAFYIGNALIDADDPNISVSYDGGIHTITGLSQDDLDKLGIVQAASALADQDAAAAGMQVNVTAWTVESGNGDVSGSVSNSLTLSVTPVLATTGANSFIWGGNAIDGKAGNDTVALRYGEDLTHIDLASQLKNVEVIDLSVPGQNSITGGLSVADVQTITGSTTGTLTIHGDAEDKVELSSASEWSTDGTVTNGHVVYTSASGLTLLIDEHVTVEFPDEAFSAPPETLALMSFGAFENTESFGLASLDAFETPMPDPSDADPIAIDEVLSSDADGEDLTAVLPTEHRDGPAASQNGGGDTDFVDLGGPAPVPALEDELRSGVHYEV